MEIVKMDCIQMENVFVMLVGLQMEQQSVHLVMMVFMIMILVIAFVRFLLYLS